ncbi:MAG: PTS sugar transporter subunit IIA [Victivallaceae bacterium]|nr:PTS sugar transporter subunit IIA [Victivallaceae bacterium]
MPCDFLQYVTKDSVLALNGTNKLEILNEMIDAGAALTNLGRDNIFRLTWKREQMMTTGIGNGLALPHIRVNDIPDPVVVVGVSEQPIKDYQSQDDEPIRVIVFVIAPDENQELYLQLLGSVSRRMRSPEVVKKLISCAGNANMLYDTVMSL